MYLYKYYTYRKIRGQQSIHKSDSCTHTVANLGEIWTRFAHKSESSVLHSGFTFSCGISESTLFWVRNVPTGCYSYYTAYAILMTGMTVFVTVHRYMVVCRPTTAGKLANIKGNRNSIWLKKEVIDILVFHNTAYSGYSGLVYSGHSDIVAPFPGTKYIYSIIFRSDKVANRI